uniref:Uncharacterized protein n=1 Tax=Daphnia galeata TaxID=27404 RepID=A0A8J2RCA7_9CRUS|nr:unnamed protein product [Daphnia galeata]
MEVSKNGFTTLGTLEALSKVFVRGTNRDVDVKSVEEDVVEFFEENFCASQLEEKEKEKSLDKLAGDVHAWDIKTSVLPQFSSPFTVNTSVETFNSSISTRCTVSAKQSDYCILIKSPSSSRIQKFKTLAPGVPLRPRPIVTHWGTWLEAAKYTPIILTTCTKLFLVWRKTMPHRLELHKAC